MLIVYFHIFQDASPDGRISRRGYENVDNVGVESARQREHQEKQAEGAGHTDASGAPTVPYATSY